MKVLSQIGLCRVCAYLLARPAQLSVIQAKSVAEARPLLAWALLTELDQFLSRQSWV